MFFRFRQLTCLYESVEFAIIKPWRRGRHDSKAATEQHQPDDHTEAHGRQGKAAFNAHILQGPKRHEQHQSDPKAADEKSYEKSALLHWSG